jgi:hypothetical protein
LFKLSFAKQSATTHAGKSTNSQLAVSIGKNQLVLNYYCIYRWCHDIGREHAASRPLLKTVFEVP